MASIYDYYLPPPKTRVFTSEPVSPADEYYEDAATDASDGVPNDYDSDPLSGRHKFIDSTSCARLK